MKHAMLHTLAAGATDSAVSLCVTVPLAAQPLLGRRCRLDSYTKRRAVGVRIEVCRHGKAKRARAWYSNAWLLKYETFTLATDRPTAAPSLQPSFSKCEVILIVNVRS